MAPSSYLLDRYGYQIVYDSGLPLNSKLSDIIKDGEWFWAAARSEDLVAIQAKLHEVDVGGSDLTVWDTRNGKYSYAATWERIREVFPIVSSWKLVWFPMAIPKHSFILWLTFRDALVTKQKMHSWRYTGPSLCPFCYGAFESRAHLFFRCSFSSRIWLHLMIACSLVNVPLDWEVMFSWGAYLPNPWATLGRLSLGASIYHIWR
jgi:hypothetical protein